MEETDWALMEEADWHFRKMVRRFVKERDKISIEGVSLPGLLILNTILRDGEQKLGELAEQLDFTSGAVTALCDKLEACGFAVRRRSESDRRSIVLDLTDAGREMLKRNEYIGGRSIERIFGIFSHEELRDLIHYFERLNDHLEGFSDFVLRPPRPSFDTPAAIDQSNPGSLKRSNKFISY
ncbi:DNA-binding transcriptional regulator, MarR family [Paenibacillus sp. cl141a]|uniref:MarR family winged helix-turn-helix transcriptional regulator n=1 Tax=Paenibacillus sp. cl141a TaxID=1761877 RepID=UPI0008BCEA1C|nr:MarR family winged helix-turn-helix transcriptional regulator [Paenibacillus sp. cl141a]SEK50156.1 DNA-binding transcriptional regulator, MarR family [Paenibacillus sp. cl141a]